LIGTAEIAFADGILAQILGQIFDRGFECGLGDAHDVVMWHDLLGAVVGEGEHGAALGHHFFGALCDGGERVDRDVHGHHEVFAAGIDVTAAQFGLVGKADGVDDEIHLSPTLLKIAEQRINRGGVADVAGQDDIGAQLFGQGADALFQRLALVGKGQIGPGVGQCLGDSPCDRFIVGEAHDQPALSRHQFV